MHACSRHFTNHTELKNLITANETKNKCSFCSSKKPTAPLEIVVDSISWAIQNYYEDPAESVPYCSAEGGYLIQSSDTGEILDSLGLELEHDESGFLIREIINSLGFEGLVRRDWARDDPSHFISLRDSWESCVSLLKHGRRFFFWDTEEQQTCDEEYDRPHTPREFFPILGKTCIKHGLIRTIENSATLYRARKLNEPTTKYGARELGPPPERLATSGRMNPPGIPVLYAAMDPTTAVAEVAEVGSSYTVGTFSLSRSIRILDLTSLPPIPGIFEGARIHMREDLLFLHYFANCLAAPHERDDRIHFEYVPTQVLAEYFRFQFQDGGAPLDGIAWPSSQRPGGHCISLFVEPGFNLSENREALEIASGDRELWVTLQATNTYKARASISLEQQP